MVIYYMLTAECALYQYCPKGLVEHGAVVVGNRWDNPELLKEGSV